MAQKKHLTMAAGESKDIQKKDNTFQELTPIRVRGKTRRRKHATSVSEENAQKRVAKSSLKGDDAAFSKERQNGRNRMLPQYRRENYHKPLSPLELLPPEVLEDILVRSLNVNLPRASPHIAWKLSHKATHNALCTAIFRYFWELPLVEPPRFSERRQEMILYLRALESALATRWMTWNFLCEFKQTFYSKYQSGVLDALPADLILSKYNLKHQSTMIKFRIPAKLLREPITGDRFMFLATLIKANGRIDWIGTTLGETAQAIWRQAVKDSHYAIVSLLMRLGVGIDTHENPLHHVVSINPEYGMIMLVWTHSVMLRRAKGPGYSTSAILDPKVVAALPHNAAVNWDKLQHKSMIFGAGVQYMQDPFPTDRKWQTCQQTCATLMKQGCETRM